jgi:hypothetical protein
LCVSHVLWQQSCLEVASRLHHVGVVDEKRRTYRHHGRQRDAPRRIATFRHATLRVATHRYATLEPLGKPRRLARVCGRPSIARGSETASRRLKTRRCSRRVCPTGSSSNTPGRSRAACSRFRDRRADAASPSRYIRKRGEGELAVRAAFNDAFFVRPAVMFGPDDAFLTPRSPSPASDHPMFGRGLTRFQPAYVEDVAEAVGRIMQRAETPSMIFEFGGPRVYSYEEFLKAVAHQAGIAPRLVPIPFAVWHALTWASEILPDPLLTRNQVELMEIDTVSSPQMPGFSELGITPHSVEAILQRMLSNCG